MKRRETNLAWLLIIVLLVVPLIPAPHALQSQPQGSTTRVIIMFAPTVSRSEQRSIIASVDGTVIREFNIINGLAAFIPSSSVAWLKQDPRVIHVDPDIIVHALDSTANSQVQADLVSAAGNSGSGVSLAILDTGINTTHPEFSRRIAACHTEVPGTTNCEDDNGHGTFVAGVAGAQGVYAPAKGVAPAVSLLIDKVLNSTGKGPFSQVIAGMDWALANNAKIISMSLGVNVTSSRQANCDNDIPTATIAVNNAIAAGMTLVAATGNNEAAGIVDIPACISNVIAVGAVGSSDNLASFSNTGLALQDHGVVAPGVKLISPCTSSTSSTGYCQGNGTSFAAPVVSGSVALMLSRNPDLKPSTMRNILFQTAKCVLGTCPNTNIGHGRINANNAVTPILGVSDNSGGGPDGAVYDPQNQRMYLADHSTNTVTVVDSNNNVVTTIPVGSSPFAAAYDPSNNRIYVTDISSNAVSVINPDTNTVVSTITVGGSPTEILYNPSSVETYAVNSNSGTVSVIDINNNVVATITVGSGPIGIALNPTASWEMYVTNYGSNSVTAISPSNRVDATITGFNGPSSIAYYPLTGYMYVTNAAGNSVSVLSSQTNNIVTTVTSGIGMQPRGIAFDQANGNLFVANWASTTVSLIGTGNTVVATDAFAGQPYQVAFDPANNEMYVLVPNAGGPSSQTGPYTPSAWLVGSYADFPVLGVGDSAGGGPDGAAFDPQNNRMYLADHNTGSVTVIDSNNNLVTTISTGQLAPFAAAFDPANGKVYVTNYSSSTVSVIDPSSNSVTATVSVTGIPQEVLYNPASQDMYIVAHNPSTGAGSVPVLDINNNLVTTIAVGLWPVGIGLNPSSNEMYVANAGSNTVTAISSANQVVTTINVGNTPSSIAYSPLTGYMYVTNAGDNSVGVFSSQTHTVVTTITTGIGKGPRGIAFDKADGFMFVANWGAPTVSIIDSTNKVVATRGVSGQPYQVVFDPANNEMYVLIPNLFGMDTTGGPRVGTAYFVGAIGDFNILANPFFLSATAGTTMMSTATLTRLNFFGDTVALTATPSNSALQCSLSPTSVSMAPSKTVTSTLSCSGTAGAYTVTVTGASTTQSHSFLVYVNVAGFSISANPSSLTLAASTCGTSIITVTSVNGWSGSVTLQASSALTAGFGSCTSFVNPTTITVSSSALTTVTIAITSGTTAATYPVSVTGTANSPALTQSAPITVTVTSSSGGGGGGGGGSIAYGSLITMSDGSKVPVQNLQVGDQMLGYDPTLGKYAVSTVKSITIVDTTNMLVIHTSAGTPFRVDANPRQTLWAKAPDGTTAWTPVTLIKRGDQLLTPNGWVQVTSIEFAPAGIHVMYDIIASVPYFADGYLDPMYKT